MDGRAKRINHVQPNKPKLQLALIALQVLFILSFNLIEDLQFSTSSKKTTLLSRISDSIFKS